MSPWESLLLGGLQGATEFLPVSSSGHLVLAEHLLHLRPSLAFNAALHAGTLAAVVAYYRRDLWAMVRQAFVSLAGLFHGRGARAIWAEDHATRLGLLIVAATIPTGIIGLALKAPVERAMAGGTATSAALLVTGVLVMITRFAPGNRAGASSAEPAPDPAALPSTGPAAGAGPAAPPAGSDDIGPTQVTLLVALAVGVAQGLAVFPGISRSGATLAAALLLGVVRADAARFAFLLSIPAILGALVLESGHLATLARGDLGSLLLGVGTAVVVGYLSLAMLVVLVRRGGLHHFAWYVIPLGLAGLVYFNL